MPKGRFSVTGGGWIKARDGYKNILVPVTLVYGEYDWSFPKEREDNQRIVPGARFFTVKDSGHFSALERPDEIVKIVLNEA